jgi:hypothetical protein
MSNSFIRWAPALASCFAPLAPALAGSAESMPAAASAPPAYRSVFADYKPWQNLEPGNWRALNDGLRSGEAGAMGDMGSMHDMSGMHRHSPSTAPAASVPASAPESAPAHSGHHMYGGNR